MSPRIVLFCFLLVQLTWSQFGISQSTKNSLSAHASNDRQPLIPRLLPRGNNGGTNGDGDTRQPLLGEDTRAHANPASIHDYHIRQILDHYRPYPQGNIYSIYIGAGWFSKSVKPSSRDSPEHCDVLYVEGWYEAAHRKEYEYGIEWKRTVRTPWIEFDKTFDIAKDVHGHDVRTKTVNHKVFPIEDAFDLLGRRLSVANTWLYFVAHVQPVLRSRVAATRQVLQLRKESEQVDAYKKMFYLSTMTLARWRSGLPSEGDNRGRTAWRIETAGVKIRKMQVGKFFVDIFPQAAENGHGLGFDIVDQVAATRGVRWQGFLTE